MTDTNIDNYSVGDILSIFNITEPTEFNVKDVANSLIAKMTTEGKNDLVIFFTQARDKVLEELLTMSEDSDIINETTESLSKLWTDGSFKDKSDNPIRYFSDGTTVTAENQAVSTTVVGPIIANHIINIDSQYRTNILPYSSSSLSNTFNTNFTFNISSPIAKVISLQLYSYQIPTSWYAFNLNAGNTFFLYNGILITIPDGNYTALTLVTAINTVALSNNSTKYLVASYNTSTNRISLQNNDPLSGLVTVVFYIQANQYNYNNCGNVTLSSFQTIGINATLGWLMGFRTTPDTTTGNVSVTINSGMSVVADVSPDTYGPKYFVLSLEDYSNHRLSSGLFNITNTVNRSSLSVPDYYSTIRADCKLREGSLTAAQQYSINAVINANASIVTTGGFDNKLSGPNSGTAFAIIPLTGIDTIRPSPYIRFGSDLSIFKRNYLGATYLQRFNVRLSDDKGNLVNLYDNDWSFSLLVEEKLN